MKKSIIVIALTLLSTFIFAQNQKTTISPGGINISSTPAPIHPGYVFDGTKPVTFTVTLTAGILYDYITILQSGGLQAVAQSDKLTGKQITVLEKSNQVISDTITNNLIRSFSRFYQADLDKFNSDTLKLYHPKK